MAPCSTALTSMSLRQLFSQPSDCSHRLVFHFDVPTISRLTLLLQSFWWPDIALLGIFFGSFTIFSYLILHFYVKEKR